jgi:hypothetical protein
VRPVFSLFMRVSVDRGVGLSIACVSARLQYGLQYMRGRQFVLRMKPSDVGQGMTEVSVVRAPRAAKELIVGRRNDPVAASSAKGRFPLLCCFASSGW